MKVEFEPIQIVGLRGDVDRAVEAIHRLGSLHLVPVDEFPGSDVLQLTLTEEQRGRLERYRRLLTQLEALAETLSVELVEGPALPRDEDLTLEDLEQRLNSLQPRVEEIVEQRRALEQELDSLPRYEATIRSFQRYVPTTAYDPEKSLFGILVNRRHRPAIAQIKADLIERLTGEVEFGSGQMDEETIALLIVVPDAVSDEVDDLLGKHDVSRLQLPEDIPRGSPESMLSAVEERQEELPREAERLEEEQHQITEEWGARLQAWWSELQAREDRLEVLDLFGETDRAFVVTGWVPGRELDELRTTLEEVLEGAVAVEQLPMTEEVKEKAPVRLENRGPAASFEGLVELLGLPDHSSLDPSPLMAVFLPMFLGMMLGDIGYGVLLLGISLAMTRRFKEGMIRDIMRILSLGGAWTILFGLLYGEAFGTLGHQLGLHPIWFDRGSPEYLSTLLAVTVGVGVVHVTLGLLIGLWGAIQHRLRAHMLERAGKLVALAGLLLVAGALAEWLPSSLTTPSVAVLILGVVLLGSAEGRLGWVLGPIEFIGLLGDILSYLRIAAIGLASVYLATVANEIAGLIGSVIVGAIVAVLMHSLNLVMGTFSPTIHSLRLHYVEFFQKFYESGGRAYRPFGGV